MSQRVFPEEVGLDLEPGRRGPGRLRRHARVAPHLGVRRRIDHPQALVEVLDRRRRRSACRLRCRIRARWRAGSASAANRAARRSPVPPVRSAPASSRCASAGPAPRRRLCRHSGRLPDRTPLREAVRILGIDGRGFLQVAAPVVELLAVEAPVALQAVEPDRRQLQHLVRLEPARERDDARRELRRAAARVSSAGSALARMRHHVLHEALVGVGAHRDVARRDHLDRRLVVPGEGDVLGARAARRRRNSSTATSGPRALTRRCMARSGSVAGVRPRIVALPAPRSQRRTRDSRGRRDLAECMLDAAVTRGGATLLPGIPDA